MLKKYCAIVICVFVGVSTLAAAGNAQPETEKTIKYRQSTFELMGWHFKQIGAMIQKRKAFSAEEFRYRANSVAMLASMLDEGFSANTQTSEAHTLLKPEMWYQRERFDGYLTELQKASKELSAFADTIEDDDINVNKLRSPFGKVARQCKACHDRFKARK